MSAAEGGRAAGYLALLRENANYRNLWLGQVVSTGQYSLATSSAFLANAATRYFAAAVCSTTLYRIST